MIGGFFLRLAPAMRQRSTAMQLLEAHSVEAFLREAGHVPDDLAVRVESLTGGVSNRVFRVTCWSYRGGPPRREFVLKQSQPQLATADPWFCTVDRIWNEVAVLEVCQQIAPRGTTPQVLFVDHQRYLFAMTAAPANHSTWKQQLLDGQADRRTARACGKLMAAIHAGTWQSDEVRQRFNDRSIFDSLRLDPYYRTTAERCPQAAAEFDRLIRSTAQHRLCLVHADFSPKNLLVFARGTMMVDFETGHFGDPAFDVGFFLSHLVLKSFYHADRAGEYLMLVDDFLSRYIADMQAVAGDTLADVISRGFQHLAGCAWARLDGKSPVDYLADEHRRHQVRHLSGWIFEEQPTEWSPIREVLLRLLSDNCIG